MNAALNMAAAQCPVPRPCQASDAGVRGWGYSATGPDEKLLPVT